MGKAWAQPGNQWLGRGIQLPEFANAAALPAADRRRRTVIGFGMGQAVGDGPATDLRPIELEVAETEHFAGGKTVGGRGLAPESFAQQGFPGGGPGGSVIASRNARRPGGLLMLGAGFEVVGVALVESAAGEPQPLRRRQRVEAAGTEVGQDLTDQGSGTAMDQLEFFIAANLAEPGDAVPRPPGICRLGAAPAGAGWPGRPR